MSGCKFIDYEDLQVESTGDFLVTWKIKHILCVCVKNEDDILISPDFEFNKVTFNLMANLFKKDAFGTFVDIYLWRESSAGGTLDVSFQIGLLDSTGKLRYAFEGRNKFEKGDDWGGPPDGIIRRADMEAKREELMPKNILTVICKLRVGGSASPKPKTTDYNKWLSGTHMGMLASDLGLLLEERKNCDVTLHLGKEEFHAHRLILGARSQVFAAMFEHDLRENHTNEVTIDDIRASDFSVVLDYIYTGQVQELSIEQAIGVYFAADKYNLKGLKSHCRDLLLNGLSTDWFFEIAVLANAHNDGKLMDGVKFFARGNVPALLSSDKCDDFFQNHPRVVLEILRSVSSVFKTKA